MTDQFNQQVEMLANKVIVDAARFQTVRTILRDWMYQRSRVVIMDAGTYHLVLKLTTAGETELKLRFPTYEEALSAALGQV